MAKLKTALPQRQTSESLQSRAVITTPVHRESIVRSNHTKIVPRSSETMAQTTGDVGGTASARRRASNPLMEKANISSSRGWRTKFCVEPPGDAGTCCMGFWVPWALYGKTHWRLRRAQLQEDALDSSWKPKYGCNGPCWAYWALGLLGAAGWHGCFQVLVFTNVMGITMADKLGESGILVGLQRSRIRVTYGIDGNRGVDMLAGLCCPVCTLIHNDREVQAREGRIALRNNKKFKEGLGSTMVKVQPRLKPPMGDIFPAPKPKPKQTGDQPQGTSGRRIEMTQTNVRNETDIVPEATRHRGGYEKPRSWPPKKHAQEQKNYAAIIESAQAQHPQSEKKHSKAVAGEQSQTKLARNPEPINAGKRSQTHNITPMVIVTRPEDSKPTGSVPSQGVKQSESSTVQGSKGGSREHVLAECSSFDTIGLTDSRSGQETHSLLGCATIEEAKNHRLDSHALLDCSAPIQPTTYVQHAIADGHNSTVSRKKELSYVHDFTDCPVDKALLKLYENQEKGVQSHDLADCIRGNSGSKVGPGSRTQQHHLNESVKSSPDEYGKWENGASSHDLAACARSSTSSPKNTARDKSHDRRDCSARSSANTSLSNNPFRQHSLGDCHSDSSPSSTVGSETQSRSVSGTVDSMGKNKSQGVAQHRLSSCPTPIAVTGNHASDDSQAIPKPTNLSTDPDNRKVDARNDRGPSGAHRKDDGSRVHRRHKGKGRANQNVIKANEGEISRSTEQSAQHSLEQGPLPADGQKENGGKSTQLLKANLHMGPEGTVQGTLR